MEHIETKEDHDREVAYKESLKADMLADAMMNGHHPHRPQANRDNFEGEEGMAAMRHNFEAVEESNHKYNEE